MSTANITRSIKRSVSRLHLITPKAITPDHSNMRRAEGPLTNGTYIAITRPKNEDLIAKVRSNGTGHDVLGTKNRNDENVEVRTMSATTCISHPSFLVAI